MASSGSGETGSDRNADLTHVTRWVFDLDNTLYPAATNLFSQIDARMRDFITATIGVDALEARRLQKDYYVRYGTTLSGLMTEHGVAPDAFLDYVHDIDLATLTENEALVAAVSALPGERFIFTNGSTAHAERVLARLGLARLFNDIFDIRAANYTPKPHRETYQRFLVRHDIKGPDSAMFEDLAHNLEAAHALGMTTVLISSDAPWIDDEPAEKRPAAPGERHAHVHFITDDLAAFLAEARLAGRPA